MSTLLSPSEFSVPGASGVIFKWEAGRAAEDYDTYSYLIMCDVEKPFGHISIATPPSGKLQSYFAEVNGPDLQTFYRAKLDVDGSSIEGARIGVIDNSREADQLAKNLIKDLIEIRNANG